MSGPIVNQFELLLRLVVAGICGFLIGYERNNRLKEAGVRTHMIVALGSALIMIVSKYGFADILALKGCALDPSRIAAQIVSGIGFLGAGMIFVRKQAISGLTTAAGVWTTAAVGMAIGAKLYFIGLSATVLVLLIQIILHKNIAWLHFPVSEQIIIEFKESDSAVPFIQQRFSESHIDIINFKMEKIENGFISMELYVKLPPEYDVTNLMNLFNDYPQINLVEY